MPRRIINYAAPLSLFGMPVMAYSPPGNCLKKHGQNRKQRYFQQKQGGR
jgi:hypothetical protein